MADESVIGTPQSPSQPDWGYVARPSVEAVEPTQFPPTVAVPGNEANLAPVDPQGLPLAPLAPLKNIGGQGDVQATINALQRGVQQSQPPTPPPDSFATPKEQQVAQPVQPELDNSANALLQTFNTRQQANNALAKAGADKAAADMGEQSTLADMLEKRQVDVQNKQIDFEKQFVDKQKYLDDVANELKTQNFSTPKVNGNRFWENQSTGGKIMAGLAIALGGIGGAYTGKGDNIGLDLINKAIDRDIEEQKFNIQQQAEGQKMKAQNLRDQMSVGNNMLQELRGKFQSDIAAETAMRSLMIQQTQTKLQAIASGYESMTVKEKAKGINAELEAQKQALNQQLKASMQQQYLQKQLALQDISDLTPMQMQQMGMSKEAQDAVTKTQERAVSGWVGQAPSREAAEKFREKAGEYQPAMNSINRIRQIVDESGSSSLPGEKRTKLETEVAGLVGALRMPITGPGILTPEERKMLEKIIGDPTRVFGIPSWQKAALNQIYKKLDSDLNQTAKNYGFRPKNAAVQKHLRPVQ
jgi:hypothetical protein